MTPTMAGLGGGDAFNTSGSVASIFVLAVLAGITNGLLLTVLLVRRPLRANPSNR